MTRGDYVKMRRERISGNKYSLNKNDREAFRVRSKKKYYHYYIGHYDSAKYQEQLDLLQDLEDLAIAERIVFNDR